MDDSRVRWHHAQVVERPLAPAQERVALLVSLELEIGVALESLRRPEHVDLDRVVDDQLSGNQRIDPVWLTAHVLHGVAHRGQVNHRRDAGEVLHQDAGRHEGDLVARLGLRVPSGQGLDVLGPDRFPVLVAEQVLQQELERERQPGHVVGVLERIQPEDLQRAVPDGQGGLGVEAVVGHGGAPRLAVPCPLYATRRDRSCGDGEASASPGAEGEALSAGQRP